VDLPGIVSCVTRVSRRSARVPGCRCWRFGLRRNGESGSAPGRAAARRDARPGQVRRRPYRQPRPASHTVQRWTTRRSFGSQRCSTCHPCHLRGTPRRSGDRSRPRCRRPSSRPPDRVSRARAVERQRTVLVVVPR
jgi:hypothetical protein